MIQWSGLLERLAPSILRFGQVIRGFQYIILGVWPFRQSSHITENSFPLIAPNSWFNSHTQSGDCLAVLNETTAAPSADDRGPFFSPGRARGACFVNILRVEWGVFTPRWQDVTSATTWRRYFGTATPLDWASASVLHWKFSGKHYTSTVFLFGVLTVFYKGKKHDFRETPSTIGLFICVWCYRTNLNCVIRLCLCFILRICSFWQALKTVM